MNPVILNGLAFGVLAIVVAMFVTALWSHTVYRTVATLLCTAVGILGWACLVAWSCHRMLVFT